MLELPQMITAVEVSITKRLKKQLRQAELQIVDLTSEIDRLNTTLLNIHSSNAWKLVRKYYQLKDKYAPSLSFFKYLKYTIKIIILINKKTFNNLFKIRSKLIKKTNKVIYIGHSFHTKTKSTRFLLNYLNKFFDVTELHDESWQGKPYIDLSFINQSHLAVIFFQNLPPKIVYDSTNNDNKNFFPMYDMMLGQPKEYWLQYNNLKIINFSKTLHKQLTAWGLKSYYFQYFPKVKNFTPGNKNKVYFWQRVNEIDINLITKLLPQNKLRIHIHKAIDPSQTFKKPNKYLQDKYKITYSDWFKTRQLAYKTIKDKAIYIAPRRYEGIGLAFLEAMSMGKAVIAPNNPTMNEYIVNNVTGYLYDLNSPYPINLKNLSQIQKKAYKYYISGRKKWLKERGVIIQIIKNI